MKPPERLLEDASIEPELREALTAEADRVEAFDLAAGLERLQAAIDAPPPIPASEAAGAGAKLKLLIGGGAAVTAAVIGIALSRPEPEPARAPSPVPAPAPIEVRVEKPTRVELPVPPPAPEPSSDPSASPSATPRTAAAAAIDQQRRLAEEVRHLGEIRRLTVSNPAAAAKKADEGHARFSGGVLYHEREAVAILALSRAGRSSEARPRAERFLRSFPKSPFADQIRSATGIAP